MTAKIVKTPDSGLTAFSVAAVCFVLIFTPFFCLGSVPEIKNGVYCRAIAGEFMCGGECVKTVGVRLKDFWNEADPKNVSEARELAENLVEKFAEWGIGVVKIENLPALTSGDSKDNARYVFFDTFLAKCEKRSIRIWANVLKPNLFPVLPVDSMRMRDPSTDKAWKNAVSASLENGADIMLARCWDPRIELAVQSRIHEWGRAFNPVSGKMRSEDAVFALWSFESDWLDRMRASDWVSLPAFFRKSFLDEWNSWLTKTIDSGACSPMSPELFFAPSENLKKGTVMFLSDNYARVAKKAGIKVPEIPEYVASNPERRKFETMFLTSLYVSHMSRILKKFRMLGGAALRAPVVASFDSSGMALDEISDIVLSGPTAGTSVSEKPSVKEIWIEDAGIADTLRYVANLKQEDADIIMLNSERGYEHEIAIQAAARIMSADHVTQREQNAPEIHPDTEPRGVVYECGGKSAVAYAKLLNVADVAEAGCGIMISLKPEPQNPENKNKTDSKSETETLKPMNPELDRDSSSASYDGIFPVSVVSLVNLYSDKESSGSDAAVEIFISCANGGKLPSLTVSSEYLFKNTAAVMTEDGWTEVPVVSEEKFGRLCVHDAGPSVSLRFGKKPDGKKLSGVL